MFFHLIFCPHHFSTQTDAPASVHSMYDGVFEWQSLCLRLEGALRDLAMSDS